MLTSKQRAVLRGYSNKLEAVLYIGKSGITPTVLKQLNDALLARELVKGKVQENCPLSVKEVAGELSAAADCEVVQTIGSRFVMYKRSSKKPIYDLSSI